MTGTEVENDRVTRMLGALVDHSQRWGMVWFGAVFWGSVLRAVGTEAWPAANAAALSIAAVVVGLAGGVLAKRRGQWV